MLYMLRIVASFVKSVLLQVYNECEVCLESNKINVMSMLETLGKVKDKKYSLIRLGDGELKIMTNISLDGFQHKDDNLNADLRNVLNMRDEKLLIAMIPTFGTLRVYNYTARKYWAYLFWRYRRDFKALLDKNYIYANANVSRFYMDYLDKSHVDDVIKAWKKIFANRKLVIIEGKRSRLGVGNDLFLGAASIKRILCPSVNAYIYKENIVQAFKKCNISKDSLVILALGPTAKIVGAKIFSFGYQVLDVGHIDVEYQWYLMGAKKKVPIKGRYVYEAGGWIGELDEIELKEYNEQIIVSVGD